MEQSKIIDTLETYQSASADTSNNTLNEIWVFDLSLATGLYALTNYAGTVMGTRRRGISRSLHDVSD